MSDFAATEECSTLTCGDTHGPNWVPLCLHSISGNVSLLATGIANWCWAAVGAVPFEIT